MFGWLGFRHAKPPCRDPVAAVVNVVPDWQPPAVRHVPAETHVKHLLTMACDAGLTGYVRSKDIVRFYGETCFLHGFVPLADRQILCEVGTRLEKRRLPVGGRSLTHYFMPDAKGVVVPMRRRRKPLRSKTKRTDNRAKARARSKAKAA